MRKTPIFGLSLVTWMCACAAEPIEPSDTVVPTVLLWNGEQANDEVNFVSYPVGSLSSTPCCIYHYSGVPAGTYEQAIEADGGYSWAAFQSISDVRHDTLLVAEFVEWRYRRDGFIWYPTKTSTAPFTITRAKAFEGDANPDHLYPATYVILKYKVVAHPLPSLSTWITGPQTVPASSTYWWSAHASGGSGSYAYRWDYLPNGGSWTQLCGPSLDPNCSRAVTVAMPSFLLQLTTTAYGGSTASSVQYVTVSASEPPPVPLQVSISGPSVVGPYFYCTNWFAHILGGQEPYEIVWSGLLSGQNLEIQGTVSTSGDLVADVFDATGAHVSAILHITYDPSLQEVHYCE
jgi:hypothetical protein